MALRWRRCKQVWRSWLLRRRGVPQPDRAEIAAARARVAMGCPGSRDGGIVQRDLCLARGYCCRCACRYCPWGYDPASGGFRDCPAARGHLG
jgi:hypothetical protein